MACYIRAGTASKWQYTAVPFSTNASPTQSPIFFHEPQSGKENDGTATAHVDISDPGYLTVTMGIDIKPEVLAAVKQPRLEIVLNQEGSILSTGTDDPSRMNVLVVAFGSDAAKVPTHAQITIKVPLTAGASGTTLGLELQPQGTHVRVWLTDGPTHVQQAIIGASQDDPDLPLLHESPTYAEAAILTIETDEPSTGSAIDLDLDSPSPTTFGLSVTTPAGPGPRPAIEASTNDADPSRRFRYAAAILHNDGSESIPGRTSTPIEAAPDASIAVSMPPAPDPSTFSAWRLYRQRLAPWGWSRLTPVADVPASQTYHDQFPSDEQMAEDEETLLPPVPASLSLDWGTSETQIAPKGLVVGLEIRSYDETLPQNTQHESQLSFEEFEFPEAGHLSVQPNRKSDEAFHVEWDAPATPLKASYIQPRKSWQGHVEVIPLPTMSAEIHLDPKTLAGIAWSASETAEVSGHVHLPPIPNAHTQEPDGGFWLNDLTINLPPKLTFVLHASEATEDNFPIDALRMGWVASQACNAALRLKTAKHETNETTGAAVVLQELAKQIGVEVVTSKHPESSHEGPCQPDSEGPMRVVAGRWANPPSPGTWATEQPHMQLDASKPLAKQVLLRASPGDAAIPGPGPGPGVVARVETQSDSPTQVATRVDGLRGFSLVRPAGPMARYECDLDLEAPEAARIVLVSTKPQPIEALVTPTTPMEKRTKEIQVRVSKITGPTHFTLALNSVDPQTARINKDDACDEPTELHINVRHDSSMLERLRVWTKETRTESPDGEPLSALLLTLDAIPPAANVSILPVPGIPDASDVFTWRENGGLRISGHIRDGARLELTATKGGDTSTLPLLDIASRIPQDFFLSAAGDVGTIHPDSSDNTIIDQDCRLPFPRDWIGRRVSWSGGSGIIESVEPDRFIVTDMQGGKPNGKLAPLLAWYRVDGEGTGIRLDAREGLLSARVGVVTQEGLRHGRDFLRAVSPGPKLRIEQLDDLTFRSPAGETDVRGAPGALAVRLAAEAAFISSWKGSEPFKRLLGHTFRPNPTDIIEEAKPATESTWLHAGLALDAERANRSLNVTARASTPLYVRNTSRIRLEQTPNTATVVKGPDALELDADGPAGPGHIRAEPALWARGSASGQAGLLSAHVKSIPPGFVLTSGWRRPELVNELDDADYDDTITLGGLKVKEWQPSVMRLVARGGPLRLGRVSRVKWGGHAENAHPWKGEGKWKWSLTDIWFLEIEPKSGKEAEAMIHQLEKLQPDGDGSQNIQFTSTDGRLTTRILSVDVGEHPPNAALRAASGVQAWPKKVAAEVQAKDIRGRFAIGVEVGLDWDIVRPYQDDETSDDSWWWIIKHNALENDLIFLPGGMQFGSDGMSPMFDAPWEPYWE